MLSLPMIDFRGSHLVVFVAEDHWRGGYLLRRLLRLRRAARRGGCLGLVGKRVAKIVVAAAFTLSPRALATVLPRWRPTGPHSAALRRPTRLRLVVALVPSDSMLSQPLAYGWGTGRAGSSRGTSDLARVAWSTITFTKPDTICFDCSAIG